MELYFEVTISNQYAYVWSHLQKVVFFETVYELSILPYLILRVEPIGALNEELRPLTDLFQ